jgi:hypothetical protein
MIHIISLALCFDDPHRDRRISKMTLIEVENDFPAKFVLQHNYLLPAAIKIATKIPINQKLDHHKSDSKWPIPET